MSTQSTQTALRPKQWSRTLLIGLGTLLSLFAIEGGLQLAVFVGSPHRLADPGAYAHPLCDAWYWRTRAQQDPDLHTLPTHPRFGWVSAKRNLDDGDVPSVVLLGDSFVAGTTTNETRIATLLQAELESLGEPARVEDLSVGGYGLDQILLRLQDRAPSLMAGTPVVIGVLTTDIDRAVLWERGAPKPRFVRSKNGELALETHHLDKGIPTPERRLLTWSRWERFSAWRDAQEAGLPHDDCRVEEKRELATALFQSLTETCTEAQLRCLVVPFLRAEDLSRNPGWRETLIETETAILDQLLLRPLLGNDEAALYGSDRHPTAHQNRIVATAIVNWAGLSAANASSIHTKSGGRVAR